MNWRSIILILVVLSLAACGKKKVPMTLTQMSSGTTEQLRSIWFNDALNGYASGGRRFESGVVVATTDGGMNWSPVASFNKGVYGIYQVSPTRVLAAGIDGKIHRSDNGSPWTTHQTLAYKDLYDVAFADSLKGVAVGGIGYAHGVLHRTFDGGITWQEDSLDHELRRVMFLNSTTGFATGYGLVMRTPDGGETWNATNASGDFFTGISFPTSSTGYVCGFNGSILKTTNGGDSWKDQRNGNSLVRKQYYLEAIRFWDASTGYAVGRNGAILVTTNGGDDWNPAKTNVSDNLYDLWLTSANSGLIVGEGGSVYQFSRN